MPQSPKPVKKKRHPRIRIRESVGTHWREKLHPFLVHTAEYNKTASRLLASSVEAEREEGERLTKNPPHELLREALQMHESAKDNPVRNNAFLILLGIDPVQQGSTISEGQYVLGWLARNKYGKSIFELTAGDAAGDEKSSKQLENVRREFGRWRYGRSNPNELRFKADHQHAPLMFMGLDLGIMALTPEELADCFDALSVCDCQDTHDGENLNKLRKRLSKDIERLIHILSEGNMS